MTKFNDPVSVRVSVWECVRACVFVVEREGGWVWALNYWLNDAVLQGFLILINWKECIFMKWNELLHWEGLQSEETVCIKGFIFGNFLSGGKQTFMINRWLVLDTHSIYYWWNFTKCYSKLSSHWIWLFCWNWSLPHNTPKPQSFNIRMMIKKLIFLNDCKFYC